MTAAISHPEAPSTFEHELHTDGAVFTPAQTTQPLTTSLLSTHALDIHRTTLNPAPANSSDFYDQHTTTPDKVRGNFTYQLHHNPATNQATATITAAAPAYLTGEAVTEYLRLLHQIIGSMEQLENPNRPVNIAAHLTRAATQLENHYPNPDTAADLFEHYLELFAAREYQSDYAPVEYLEESSCTEADYTALADAGLIAPMLGDNGELSAYYLRLFSSE